MLKRKLNEVPALSVVVSAFLLIIRNIHFVEKSLEIFENSWLSSQSQFKWRVKERN